MRLSQSEAESRISSLGMDDMPIIQIQPSPAGLSPDWFIKYKETCRKFMMSLTDCIDTLAVMNLPQEDFINLIMGRTMLPNMSIRFRIPLTWGGQIDIDNMFMCLTFPHSYNMDRFIIGQTGNETLWVPNPAQKIYLPARTFGGGDGGNGTEDRLTENIAAQIAASRDF